LITLSHAENSCPNSYVYAYDESSNSALWTCDSGLNSDYKLTFCPYVLSSLHMGPVVITARLLTAEVGAWVSRFVDVSVTHGRMCALFPMSGYLCIYSLQMTGRCTMALFSRRTCLSSILRILVCRYWIAVSPDLAFFCPCYTNALLRLALLNE
jgi:hypothetical protein